MEIASCFLQNINKIIENKEVVNSELYFVLYYKVKEYRYVNGEGNVTFTKIYTEIPSILLKLIDDKYCDIISNDIVFEDEILESIILPKSEGMITFQDVRSVFKTLESKFELMVSEKYFEEPKDDELIPLECQPINYIHSDGREAAVQIEKNIQEIREKLKVKEKKRVISHIFTKYFIKFFYFFFHV